MVCVIDNYDSFTYNLVQYLGELGAQVRVMRNDAVTLDDIARVESRAHRHFARPRPARRCRHHDGRDQAIRASRRRSSASASAIRRSARCSAGPSCARRCRCTARPRRSSTTAAACFQRHHRAVRRVALSLARRGREGFARRSRNQREDEGRRHHHGAPASAVADSRRAVSSRIDPDERGPQDSQKLSTRLGTCD